VVVVVCPQTAETIADQNAAACFPAERWVRSRFFHDQVVGKLCACLAASLESEGTSAVIPDSLAGFATYQHPRFQIASSWSHRHAAFAAGLGTFGLCDGLITKAGKAHRLCSLIADFRFEPSDRPYLKAYEYCLFFSNGSCGKCVGRCPASALGRRGHDKALCRGFLDSTTSRIEKAHADLPGAYACGLCQSAVPCGNRIPG
jgi:epoxyqueuosine reductase QueG